MPVPFAQKRAERPLRVIYADDMKELRELMRIVLSGEGHFLETFENGRLALGQLSRDPDGYDLLITDHHMPVINGLELVQQVRQLPFPGKILVFSSELSPFVHDEYVALKVDRVLAKPIRPAALRHLLVEIFSPLPALRRG